MVGLIILQVALLLCRSSYVLTGMTWYRDHGHMSDVLMSCQLEILMHRSLTESACAARLSLYPRNVASVAELNCIRQS